MDQNDYKPLATADNQMLDNFLTAVILKVRTLLTMCTYNLDFFSKIIGQVFFNKLHESSCFDLLQNAVNSEGI